MRSASHMMGMAGLSEDGKLSSWGPGRKQIQKDDDQILPARPPPQRALYEEVDIESGKV